MILLVLGGFVYATGKWQNPTSVSGSALVFLTLSGLATGASWGGKDEAGLEVYRTVIGTLQSLAWMLLVFFGFALIAYVVVRGLQLRRQGRQGRTEV